MSSLPLPAIKLAATVNDMAPNNDNTASLFSAVSGSARQLFLLLRCINFVSKAQVRITKEGLRFTVEESQVMQGLKVRGPYQNRKD